MKTLNKFSNINAKDITKAAESYKTPFYLYDEQLIINKCKETLSMPNAYGLDVRYAMKANSNRTILQIISNQGLLIDASSLNEAKRAVMAGIDLNNIILTTQEVPEDEERKDLQDMILKGLVYNVCSLRQLYLIGDFAKEHSIELSIRIHPGTGSGESASRNTGDDYACFGIHLSDLEEVLRYVEEKGIKFKQVHTHIGSGADSKAWRENIDTELAIVEKYFPYATTVSFGGGLKEARMPDEKSANVEELGIYAKQQIENFYNKTGRKLKMEIEPGTYIMANSGYVITKIIDKKRTGEDGLNFIITNGGMEINTRPLMYGARHPFYIISKEGELVSSEFDSDLSKSTDYEVIVVGTCCETGDSQCIDRQDNNIPRKMREPNIGDIAVIGGTGAYCSSMSPFNYNSHTQIAEVLFTLQGQLKIIRRRQTLEEIITNETLV